MKGLGGIFFILRRTRRAGLAGWSPRSLPGFIVAIAGIFLMMQSGRGMDFIKSLNDDRSWRRIDNQQNLSIAGSNILYVTPGFRDRVWLTHKDSNFISGTDGYSAEILSLQDNPQVRIIESRTGQVWTHTPSEILLLHNNRWTILPISSTGISEDIVSILPAEYNHVLVLLGGALFELDLLNNVTRSLISPGEIDIGRFKDIRLARDQGAWIIGDKGLARIPPPIRNLTRNFGYSIMKLPPDWNLTLTESFFEIEPGHALIQANLTSSPEEEEDVRLPSLASWDGKNWRIAISEFSGWEQLIPAGNRQAILTASPLPVEITHIPQENSARIQDIACLPDGSWVIATDRGFFKETENLWKKFSNIKTFQILEVDESENAAYALTSEGFSVIRETGDVHTSPWPGELAESGLTPAELRVRQLDSSRFWIQLENSDWVLDTRTASWTPQQLPSVSDGSTRVPNRPVLNETGEFLTLWAQRSPAGQEIFGLDRNFDVRSIQPMTKFWPDAPAITDIAHDVGDALWVATNAGLAFYDAVNWTLYDFQMLEMPFPISDVQLSRRGPPLFACQDGIYEFNGQSFVRSLSSGNPVRQILQIQNGGLWAATESTIFRLVESSWISYGSPEDLSASDIYSVFEDRRRTIWVASDTGIFKYASHADYDPPESSIILTPQEIIPEKSGIILTTVAGTDKWNHTSPERLLFSYQVDNGDWTPFRENRVLLINNLQQGNHSILVRAMDRNGNMDASPARWDFKLIIPWHYDYRIVTMVIITSLSLLFLIWLALDRHLSLQRSYRRVEQIVEERTHQLEAANEQLLMHQKMRAIGALTAGIAHDFNSILSIVQGSAQIIKANLHKPEKISTRVERIETVVNQGSSLVKAMLGFTREKNIVLEVMDLAAVVGNTLEMLNDRRPEKVSLTFTTKCHPDGSLPPVVGNREFLQQILVNLILNAFDALDNEGRIEIVAANQDIFRDRIHIHALRPRLASAHVSLYIQDSGCGMSHEIMERAFEPFFTTKALSTKKGTGLGLSMVYELAQQMKFGLGVGSVEGEYSIFVIEIPVADESDQASK